MLRDQLPRLPGEEAVRLRVVDLAAGDRGGDRLEVGRVHLVVGRHHAGDVDPLLDRALVAGDDRCADALVLLVGRGPRRAGRRSRRREPARRSRRAMRRRRRRSRSTKPGIPASVSGSSASSSWAGTTTATRLPSSIRPPSGAAADERVPEQRREDPDDQADQAADRGAGAAVRPGGLDRDGRRADAARFSTFSASERNCCADEPVGLELAEPLLDGDERGVDVREQEQLLGRRERLVARGSPAAAAARAQSGRCSGRCYLSSKSICSFSFAIFTSGVARHGVDDDRGEPVRGVGDLARRRSGDGDREQRRGRPDLRRGDPEHRLRRDVPAQPARLQADLGGDRRGRWPRS